MAMVKQGSDDIPDCMLNIRALFQYLLRTILVALLPTASLAASIHIVVDTEDETLSVMRGETLIRTFEDIAIGRYGKTYFKRKGDNKTPLGNYIFLGLTYPDLPAADRALQEGRIDASQWLDIRDAHRAGETPSQATPLGGYIGIHGLGRGELSVHQEYNWTNGCIALTNGQLDELLRYARIGTRVEIR
jgi:L,D-peptidoglycan transpeptidase YkuD (ErfK/YbiS/YcfS/YnhG family)